MDLPPLWCGGREVEMSKNTFPLSWHEECLRNMKASLLREEKRLREYVDSQIASIENLRKDIETSELQIARAKKEGKTEFDRERYNVKKGGK